MATGTVKWFNPTKGYGFVQPDSGEKDVFIHITALGSLRTLNEGQRISFDIVDNRGKTAAANVQLVDE